MSESFKVQAEARVDEGKGASRRLRRLEGKTPAIVYGGQKPPKSISVIRKDLEKMLESEAFYTALIDIELEGETEAAILKDVQRHPAKGFAMHVDFLRVEANKPIKVNIPLHFINEEQCVGVKVGGGMVQHQATDVEVQCLPKDIPEYIEVDMADIELGGIVHISDLVLPTGVESTALALGDDHDLAIASVMVTRGPKSADEDDVAADEAGTDVDTSDDEES